MSPDIKLTGKGLRRALTRHPWVYRDLIESGEAPNGSVVRVVGPEGRQLGVAAYSEQSKIALRFLSFGEHVEPPNSEDLRTLFSRAMKRRASLLESTNAIRIISSEADGLPGLIVDRYADAVSIQALTPFADRILPDVTGWLEDALAPAAVVLRNDPSVRRLEGLPREVKVLKGGDEVEVEVHDSSIRLGVNLIRGQKTGLFLDQRSNRRAVAERLGEGDSVLDVFTYDGGFALHACGRGARALAVDDSSTAIERAQQNATRNQFDQIEFEKGNAFHVLKRLARERKLFDAVILDPPAFAKNRKEVDNALRGYHEINQRALRLVREGGVFVSASCSFHIGEDLFEEMLRRAAVDARREVIVLERRGQDLDHPVLLSLPESRYLKCFIVQVL